MGEAASIGQRRMAVNRTGRWRIWPDARRPEQVQDLAAATRLMPGAEDIGQLNAASDGEG